jgi:hypothetical protein
MNALQQAVIQSNIYLHPSSAHRMCNLDGFLLMMTEDGRFIKIVDDEVIYEKTRRRSAR